MQVHHMQAIAESGSVPMTKQPIKLESRDDRMAGNILAAEVLAFAKGNVNSWRAFAIRVIGMTPEARAVFIKAIKGLVPANEIILLRAPDSVEVTVNKKYFGDLTRQDATRGAFTQGGLIGNATPHSLKIFTSRQILALLLQYQVILTYAHIEADICLIREQTQNGLYSAALTGEHTYYTNSRNVSSFGFEFTLNEKTGEMRVARP